MRLFHKTPPPDQDELCQRNNHDYDSWESTTLWSERGCKNCGYREIDMHHGVEFLNRTNPSKKEDRVTELEREVGIGQ